MDTTSFVFKCPHCHGDIEAQQEWRGQVVQCPYCGKGIVVPKASNASQPPPRNEYSSVKVSCPWCGYDHDVKRSFLGQKVNCLSCGKAFIAREMGKSNFDNLKQTRNHGQRTKSETSSCGLRVDAGGGVVSWPLRILRYWMGSLRDILSSSFTCQFYFFTILLSWIFSTVVKEVFYDYSYCHGEMSQCVNFLACFVILLLLVFLPRIKVVFAVVGGVMAFCVGLSCVPLGSHTISWNLRYELSPYVVMIAMAWSLHYGSLLLRRIFSLERLEMMWAHSCVYECVFTKLPRFLLPLAVGVLCTSICVKNDIRSYKMVSISPFEVGTTLDGYWLELITAKGLVDKGRAGEIEWSFFDSMPYSLCNEAEIGKCFTVAPKKCEAFWTIKTDKNLLIHKIEIKCALQNRDRIIKDNVNLKLLGLDVLKHLQYKDFMDTNEFMRWITIDVDTPGNFSAFAREHLSVKSRVGIYLRLTPDEMIISTISDEVEADFEKKCRESMRQKGSDRIKELLK